MIRTLTSDLDIRFGGWWLNWVQPLPNPRRLEAPLRDKLRYNYGPRCRFESLLLL